NGSIFNYLNKGIPFNQCFNKIIEDGGRIAGGIWSDMWIDVGRPWDILRATEFILSKLSNSIISNKAKIEPNVEIKGPVIIEEGAELLNGSIIKGPVYIAKNAFIGNNSLIRDNTSIGEGSKVGMGVEIRSSVVMDHASIARLSYLGASIMGPGSVMHSGSITINTPTPKQPITTIIQGKEVIVPIPKFGAVIGAKAHIGVHSSLLPGTIVNNGITIHPHKIIGGLIDKQDMGS
ncbi:MAG: hypothetical protein OEY49_16805, partial [Candidatus Heimdallarchaeota archaeon]|nr:hypothetical protein [Candidatus Heimdallarchaeota archaeon]